VSEPGRSGPREWPGGAREAVLRAKYLDFCSARVAEVLLGLTPDEMYVLAQDAARDQQGRANPDELSYDQIVHLATARISRKLNLPPFETWVVAYQEDPARFEQEMLGLWRSEVEN
jgi:hypothetical protein